MLGALAKRLFGSANERFLKGLDPDDFNMVPREQRPEMSVGAIFRQVVGELFQHQGHISYLKGLQRPGS